MGEKNTATNFRKRYIVSIVVNWILLAIIVALWLVLPREKNYGNPSPMTKSNLHAMQVALERYADANFGYYPLDLNALVHEGIMYQFPPNPFSDNKPMSNIPFCTPDSPGNFTYVPLIQDCQAIGFYLFCYGGEDWKGAGYFDIDGDGIEDNIMMIVLDEKRGEFDRSIVDPVLAELLNPGGKNPHYGQRQDE